MDNDHDAFLDGEGDLWVWIRGAFRLWIQDSRGGGRIGTAAYVSTRAEAEERFGKGDPI